MSTLTTTGLKVSFGGRVVFDHLSLTCNAGEIAVVMGASGCGKTTLLRTLGGMIHAEAGSIDVGGDDGKWAVAYMPQGDSLLPWLTVMENILMPLTVGRRRKAVTAEDRATAQALLDSMRIGPSATQRPSELSGGMRQRVALARGMITSPRLLLLDEPFSALDDVARLALEQLVRGFVDDSRASCIFVTHSVDQALAIGDSIYFMAGRPAFLARINEIDRCASAIAPADYGVQRAKILARIHA